MTGHSAAGVRTREAIIPVWDEWMFRKHGNVSFHLTQILTGHGVFYSYLRRLNRVTTDRCPHCMTGAIDTMEHTLTICIAWASEREELLRKLDMNAIAFNLKSMIGAMVQSKESWAAAQCYVEKVMFDKEEKERQLERENIAVASTDDDNNNS